MEENLNNVVEEVCNEVGMTEPKTSKKAVFGIAAAVAGLLFVFRKKISTNFEGFMVKKLNKKGYTVFKPDTNEIQDDLLKPIE